MARRKTTTRRRKTAARKSTTRRRAPARRKKTTRRKSTTRRRKSPAKRRRTTRRKSPAKRRKTTRRKSTTRRRKSPAKRRKTTRRKSTTRRRKSPAKRRKTTRRKSTTRRRKSPARRRTARRKSTTRRRTARRRTARRRSARRMRMPSLGGFTGFVKKHMDLSALGVVLAGLALPSVALMVSNRLNITSRFSNVPVIGNILGNDLGQVALGVGVSSALAYAAVNFAGVNEKTAIAANMTAIGVLTAGALVSRFPDLNTYFKSVNPLNGYRGSIAGYRGGYLGYLGNVHEGMGEAPEMLPAPQGEQLFGVGSAPRVNVF